MANRNNRKKFSFDLETENFLVNEAERTDSDVPGVVASLVARERARRFDARKNLTDVWALGVSRPYKTPYETA